MPEMELDEKALTQAAKAICAVQSKGNCPPQGCVECINSDEYGFAPEARAAIHAYFSTLSTAPGAGEVVNWLRTIAKLREVAPLHASSKTEAAWLRDAAALIERQAWAGLVSVPVSGRGK